MNKGKEKSNNSGILRKVIIAILPGLLVAGLVFSANYYYDLDTSTVKLQEKKEISVSSSGSVLTVTQSGAGYAATFMGGYVGIGTTTPATTLTVFGTSTFMGGNVGIGTTEPTRILGLGGTAARNIGMERGTTADTAGFALTVNAGGATSGATNKAGGDLNLASGISTGTGTSNIYFQTATALGAGTADRTPSTKLTILGSGKVGIGTAEPVSALHIKDNNMAELTIEGAGWDYVNASLVLKATQNANGYDSSGVFMHGTYQDVEWFAGRPNNINDSYIIARQASLTGHSTTVADPARALLTILSSGNVGIGTTSPSYKLDVSGGSGIVAQFSGRVIGVNAVNSNELATLYQLSSGGGPWSRTGSYVYLTTSTDSVGIGTSTPAYALDVYGTSRLGSSTSTQVILRGYVQSDIIPFTDSIYNLGSSNFRWGNIYAATGTFGGTLTINSNTISGNATTTLTTTAGSLILNPFGYVGIGTSTPATTLTVFGTSTFMGGNVGIGTTSPAYKLDVNGNIRATLSLTAGINVETLTADKTLTPGTDKMSQYLNPGTGNRIITLATTTALAGDRFAIRNNKAEDATSYNLQINQGATVLDYIFAQSIREYIFNGTNWVSADIGTGISSDYNVAIGYNTYGYGSGVAVGRSAQGSLSGAAVGYDARGYNGGAAVGYGSYGYGSGAAVGNSAQGQTYGAAVGENAKGLRYGAALGYRAGYSINTAADRYNTVIGAYSGYQITTGTGNIVLGYRSGYDATYSPTTGSNNILLGYQAGTPANNTSNFLNIGNLIFATGVNTASSSAVSTGLVGIGTTGPLERLHLEGNMRLGLAPTTFTTTTEAIGSTSTTIPVTSTTGYPSAGTLLIDSEAMTYTGITATTFTGATRGALGTTPATHTSGATVKNYIFTAIATSTAPRMVITGDGNVGIGTATPSYQLHIKNTVSAPTLTIEGPYNSGIPSILLKEGDPTQVLGMELRYNPAYSDGALFDFYSRAGMVDFTAASIEVNSGHFAIGGEARNSGANLQVIGNVAIGGYAGFANPPTNGLIVSGNVGIGTTTPAQTLTIQGTSTTPILGVFASSSAPVLYVNSAGNVGIGTAAPTYKLSIVTATASDRGINIANTAVTGTNYGVYSSVTGAATKNVGGYFEATGATTGYGLEVAALTSATSRGLDIGALSGGTANVGINVGAISGAGMATALNTGDISSTGSLVYQLKLGAITGSQAAAIHVGINVGNISGTASEAYGINLGTITGATANNYGINIGAINTTNAYASYGLNIEALAGTGTYKYGIKIAAPTATGTATYGMSIGGPTGAATNNYGLNITQPSGGTHNSALTIGAVTTTAGNWSLYNASIANSYFAGNVGIGTSTPRGILDVWGGDVYIGTSTTPSLYVASTTGRVGIGTANPTSYLYLQTKADSTNGLTINANQFLGAASPKGLYVNARTNPSDTTDNLNLYGIDIDAYHVGLGSASSTYGIFLESATGGGGTVTNIYGLYSSVYTNGANATNLYSIYSKGTVSAGTTVNKFYGFYVANPTGSGSLTSNYGLYIENMTKGSSDNYAIYSAGGTNYFGGNVGIGTTTPAYALDVYGTSRLGSSTSTQVIFRGYVQSDIIPYQDSIYNLGSSNFRWGNIYAATGTFGGTLTINSNTISGNATTTLTTTAGALILNPSGYVGIGTTTPASTLGVFGTSTFMGGNVGIGTTNPTRPLHVNFSYSGTAEKVAAYVNYSINSPSDNSSSEAGIMSELYLNGSVNYPSNWNGDNAIWGIAYNNTSGTVTTLNAGRFSNFNLAAGTTTYASGVRTYIENQGGGIITNAYGVYVENPYNYSGTISNVYGVYIAGQTAGATSNFALYAAGSAKSYFGGNVGIGTTSPAYRFDVNEDITGKTAALRSRISGSSAGTTYAGIFDNANTGGTALGVYGSGGSYGVYGLGSITGVYGTATTYGVYGYNNNASGYALVADQANASGYALYATGGKNYFSGNVGIGTTGPSGKLMVEDLTADPNVIISSGNNPGVINDTTLTLMGKDNNDVQANKWGLRNDRESAGNTFKLLYGTTGDFTDTFVTINSTGNVGIGTTTPAAKLDIYSAVNLTGLKVNQTYVPPDGGVVYGAYVTATGGGAPPGHNNIAGYFSASGATLNYGLIVNSGLVGIGTTTPATMLQVYGRIRMNEFQLGTSATSGYVLTTDPSGVGTWQAAAGGGLSGGQTNYIPLWTSATTQGTSTIYQSSGYIGIGTTSPAYLLDVYGTSRLGSSTSTQAIFRGYVQSDIIPYQDSIYNLGSSNFRWGNIYAATGTFGGTLTINSNTISGNATTTLTTTAGSLILNPFGYVGIGTTTPASTLGVYGTSTFMGGNVGIGTASPAGMLHINNPVGASAWSDTSGLKINTTGSLGFSLNINNGGFVIESSSGEVGIGIDAPGSKLVVKGNTSLSTGSALSVTNSNNNSLLFVRNDGLVGIGTTTPAAKLDIWGTGMTDNGLYVNIATTSSSYYGLNVVSGGTSRLYVRADGNVGIGTSTPATTLTVFGTSTFMGGYVGIGRTNPQTLLHIGSASTSQITSPSRSLFVSGELEVVETAYLGPMEFPANSGVISWIDMPVSTSTAADTIQSYTARLAGTDILTVYGEAVGTAGGIKNTRVGIGTTNPQEKLTISSGSNFAIEMATTTGVTTATTTGGTLSAGTYYFKVVASDGVGTTIGSSEVSRTILAGEAINISWSDEARGSSYRVYGNTSGSQSHYFATTATSYIYATSTGATQGTVPTVTTAYVNKLTASGNSWFLGGNLGIGTAASRNLLHVRANDKTDSAVTNLLTLTHDTTGASGPAAGLGSGIIFAGETSTTENQDMAQIDAIWTTITDASRASALRFHTFTATGTGVPGGALVERMRIDSSGNVGIGTAGPLERLHLEGNMRLGLAPTTLTTTTEAIGSTSTTIPVTSTSGYPSAGTLLIDSEAMTYATTTTTAFGGAGRGALGTTAAGHASGATVKNYIFTAIATSTAPRMVITGDGNVGIGTTNPNNLLSVYQLIDFNNTDFNTKLGYQAGKNIVSGAQNNIFLGYQAGLSSVVSSTNEADYNTGIGSQVLYVNTTGYQNSAMGYQALYSNTTGNYNSAMGVNALYSNTTGNYNLAMGGSALRANTTGNYNLAMGGAALYSLAGAYHNNTALGFQAGRYQADGSTALTTPSQSVYIGSGAMGFNDSDVNSIVIGYLAKGIGANKVVLGNDSIVTTALKGNVGIGTSSPATLFTVATTSNIFNVLSNGNVGIGTTTPNNLIQVKDLINFDNAIYSTFLGYQAGNVNTGNYNSSVGYQAGYSNSSGGANAFFGYQAGYSGNGIYNNTAVGYQAGYNNVANNNTSVGYQAGYANSGVSNTFLGYTAGIANTSGGYNVFVGNVAGIANTTGYSNVFIGDSAGGVNVSGWQNTFLGGEAGYANNSGNYNTAVGYQAGYAGASGNFNTSVGMGAGYLNTGADNVYVGFQAGMYNQAVSGNAVFGTQAGYGTGAGSSFANTTLVGYRAGYGLTTGDNNILLGYQAGDNLNTGSNNIIIGYDIDAPSATANSQLSIGNLIFATGGFGTSTTVGTGNVGIGDASPSQRLDIDGTNPQILLEESTTEFLRAGVGETAGTSIIGYDDGDKFQIGVYSSPTDTTIAPYVTIDSTGNVGIGTSSPATLFTVATTSNIFNVLSNGRVGIGTTTPNNLLQVYNLVNFNNTNYSTLLGYQAGRVSTGNMNAYVGYQAGYSSIDGERNTFVGYAAGYSNLWAGNTYVGSEAGYSNAGSDNVMMGYRAGYNNTASNETIIGNSAGMNGTGGGGSNTIIGSGAGTGSAGYQTTIVGAMAGSVSSMTGTANAFFGYAAGIYNDSGSYNTVLGGEALYGNSSGSGNTVVGHSAGRGTWTARSNNSLFGYGAGYLLSTGSNNLLFGYQAGDNLDTGSNNIIIGYDIDAPLATSTNTLSIGNLIFATGLDGTGTTLSTGNVGIGTSTPPAYAKLTICYTLPCTLPAAGTSTLVLGSWNNATTSASIRARGTITASLADIGEYVRIEGVTKDYESGDLLEASMSPGVFRKSSQSYSPALVGPVTNASAFIAGAGNVTWQEGEVIDGVILSLSGQVQVKVSAENGPIQVGDPLTSASQPGVAMKATAPGRVIGMALESFGQASSTTGKILVFVNPHWYAGKLAIDGSLATSTEGTTTEGTSIVQGSSNFDEFIQKIKGALASLGLFIENGIVQVRELIADKIFVKKARIEKIEMVDQTTGEIYCTWIENGEWQKMKGECDEMSTSVSGGGSTGDTNSTPTPEEQPVTGEQPPEGGSTEEPVVEEPPAIEQSTGEVNQNQAQTEPAVESPTTPESPAEPVPPAA